MKLPSLPFPRVAAIPRFLALLLGATLLPIPASAALLLEEDFGGGLSAWSTTGTWGLEGGWASDSPGAFYTNDTDSALTLGADLDLSGTTQPVLAFTHRHDLEGNYDFATVEASTDGGSSWSLTLATYTGTQAESREQLDLSALAGEAAARLRFRLVTDGSVVNDGWRITALALGEAPAAVTLSAPSEIGRNHVALSWSASAASAFEAYEIVRSRSASFDWRSAHTVAVLPDAATTSYTDLTVSPKTRYHYRVVVHTLDGLRAASDEVSALTPAGMDYPFLDNGEGGGATWVADAPWALSDEHARSGAYAWSDSPGAPYANGISAQSLTLAAPLDLSSATDPVWTFWYRCDLASGDFGYAEVSTDLGATWTPLRTLGSADQTETWQPARISLAAYRLDKVLLRLRLTTNATVNADGLHLDDLSVAEAPAAIPTPAVSAVGSHEATLSWTASSHPQLSHYALHRATGTDATFRDELIATITPAGPLTFTDTELLLNTDYAYRLYAVTAYGTYSADSAEPARVHTLSQPPPFADGFEGSAIAWTFGSNNAKPSTWAFTSEDAHDGGRSLTDSPSASYAPSTDSYAETAVDLSGTTWPVLTFWDKIDLGAGDWIRLEVSATGGPTAQLYGAFNNVSRAEWRRQRIDLSPWKGFDNVRLRFRLFSNADTSVGNGWFLDALEVAENPDAGTPLPLPFTEDFEAGLQDQWLAAGWHRLADASALDGAHSARSVDGDYLAPDTQHALTLDQPLVLPAGSAVQATFWLRGRLTYRHSHFRLHYSTNAGVTWAELPAVNLNHTWENEDNWTRLQADLSSLAGQTVRLRLVNSVGGAPVAFLHLDKLTLAEMPARADLLSALPSLRGVDLNWAASSLGADFARYELWRSTSANVSVTNGTKVFESTDPATLAFADSGLNIGGTYYYRLFVVDQRDTYIPSNELSATTVPVSLPLSDNLDTTDNFVIGSNNANAPTWAIVATDPHEGAGALAVVPVGQYAPSTDSYVETAVDLSGTTWPVLTFWDKLDLGAGDWVRLEVSATGGPTAQLYGAFNNVSRAEWRQQRIDLSPWKGFDNVRLRFRLVSNADTSVGNGWFLDALEVAENPDAGTHLSLPFTEDFEAGLQDQWLAAGWHRLADASAPDGSHSARSVDGDYLAPDTQHALTLDQPLVLPADSAVQATFWLRGRLTYRFSYFRLQASTNAGVTWSDLSAVNLNHTWENEDNWTRLQADLSSFAGQTVRLRLVNSVGGAPVAFLHLDKLTLAEMPARSDLLSALPSLRGVDLNWAASSLGADFARYELWRSTSANVSVTNGTKVFESTDPATLAFADSGLNIGGTYYYRLFVVDQRDTYIPSNELSATTVPVSLPLSDNLDTTDNFVIGSNNATAPTWAIVATDPHEGAGALAVVPVGQYAPSTDSYVETAVDLSETTWPVLTFWDKLDLGAGDWVRLEVSATGGPTAQLYGAFNNVSRAEWRQQRIDLSPWKGFDNVRLRFRLVSNADTSVGNGWFLDALEVAENPDAGTPLSLPFTEDFEAGLQDQWLAAGWHRLADASAPDGSHSARSVDGDYLAPDTQHALTLDQPLVLPAGSAVQATFWLRGRLTYRFSYFRLQASTNAGVTWSDLSAVNLNHTWENEDNWTRLQADLSSFAGQTVRLRLVNSVGGAPVAFLHLDKLTLAEMPVPVSAQPVDEIGVTTLRLNWIPSDLPTFVRYRIHRSPTSTVTTASELVAEITDPTVGHFTDTGLEARTTYYYKVHLVDDRDSHSPSSTLSATTLGLGLPLADDFEGDLAGWTVTGDWQVQSGVGRDGSAALVDSAGDYAPSTDTHARFAVDLTGMTWPVLRFWDKHAFAGGSWGRLELSTDGTNFNQILYGVTGTRAGWREQAVDLSPWKNQSRVFLRFRRGTDGNLADGWTIDDLSLEENATAPAYPVWDDFEGDTGLWLASRWAPTTDLPKAGERCLGDSLEGRYAPDAQQQLVLAHELDLAAATDPVLSFFVRGSLVTRSYFRVQVSTNEGLTWSDLSSLNLNFTYSSPETWEFKQASLAAWVGQRIRLRFVTSATGQPDSDLFLDNIGIGEGAPAAPGLVSPLSHESVDILRPTLTVSNAIDYQSDALTYRFEVYSDEALSNVVAQVPAVASGLTTTTWTVDLNLADNATYYWRARASDGSAEGPWSESAVFFVNETNTPPPAVLHVGPPESTTLYDGDEWLIWRAAADPDVGDSILDYRLQLAGDPGFATPLITIDGITAPSGSLPGSLLGLTLAEIPGAESLAAGRWYWRVRARDSRFAEGAWPTAAPSFRIASDYEHWLRETYPVAALDNPALTGPTSDHDGDAIPLMMEYACAMDPEVASLEGAPTPTFVWRDGVPHLAFEFDRRVGTELRFLLEASDALGTWADTGATLEVLEAIDPARERCRLVDPLPASANRFLRVTVVLP
jgi:hypothetical protein